MTVLLAINVPVTAGELTVDHWVDDRNNDVSQLQATATCVVGERVYDFSGASHYGKKTVDELLEQHYEWGNTSMPLTCPMVHKEDIGAVCDFIRNNFYTQTVEIML